MSSVIFSLPIPSNGCESPSVVCVLQLSVSGRFIDLKLIFVYLPNNVKRAMVSWHGHYSGLIFAVSVKMFKMVKE